MCIFRLTFYAAFLTVAVQKCREGCTVSSKISILRPLNWKMPPDPADPAEVTQ